MRLVPALVAALGPATAWAQSAGLDCRGTPTYYPRGDRWVTVPEGTVPPIRPLPITYRIFVNGSDDVATEDDKTAVVNAASRWSAVRCATLEPSIRMARGADYATADAGDRATHVVYWVESGWDGDSSTIALTTNEFVRDSGYLIASDMAFNGEDFLFRAGAAGCSTSGANRDRCYDVEAVAVHEFGHFLGFDHVQCTDAVMFPKADPLAAPTPLSEHETAGLCAVYPPRGAGTSREFGEQCAPGTGCVSGLACVISATDTLGWCTKPCLTTGDCPAAYVCAVLDDGVTRFCRPGPHDSGKVQPPPTPGLPPDLCRPCTAGSQCSNGLCLHDGVHPEGICSVACDPSGGSGLGNLCPVGMSCVEAGRIDVCWPNSGVACAQGIRPGGLNDTCYDAGDASFTACGPDLLCFFFRDRPEGQVGACVPYCNDTDAPCPDANQTCCYAVDANGGCVETPPAGPRHGGCFDIRREGEACVLAEQSICGDGLMCVYDPQTGREKARCMRTCDTQVCGASQYCVDFGVVSLCCKRGTGGSLQFACEPALDPAFEVGVACAEHRDCDSRLCLLNAGKRACSRTCNATTQYGCPGNIDVNEDGIADGGFDCRPILGGSYCWPKSGPILPPRRTDVTLPMPIGGCCDALQRPPGSGDLWLGAATWAGIALVAAWRLRRKRAA